MSCTNVVIDGPPIEDEAPPPRTVVSGTNVVIDGSPIEDEAPSPRAAMSGTNGVVDGPPIEDEAPPPRAVVSGTNVATDGPSIQDEVPRRAEVAARVPRAEPRSPFLSPSIQSGPSLDELVAEQEGTRPLIVELVCDAAAVVERIQDPRGLESMVLGSLAVVAGSTALFAGALMGDHGAVAVARAAGLSSFSVMLGLAAALGPIYATSVVLAARLPLGRLVGVLLAAVASGALVLAALAPLAYGALRLDGVWAGPLAAVGAFGIMGAVTGLRLWRLLHRLAGQGAAPLDAGARFRVGILARMALAFTGLTTSLAFWAFDAFLVG